MAQLFKKTGIEVARMASESAAFDDEAEAVLAAVRANAAGISDTGDFLQSIGIEVEMGKKGVLDRVIYSDDEGAPAIEYGHKAGGTFVPGHHVFTRVAEQ